MGVDATHSFVLDECPWIVPELWKVFQASEPFANSTFVLI